MNTLPSEIQTMILANLDGRSLGRAAKVCPLWNEIVSNLTTFTNIWYKACMKEIGVDTLVALTGLTQLASETGRAKAEKDCRNAMFWRNLFGIHQRYKRCHKKVWCVRKFTGTERLLSLASTPLGFMNNGKVWAGDIYGGHHRVDPGSGLLVQEHSWISLPSRDLTILTLGGCRGYKLDESGSEPRTLVMSTSRDGVIGVSEELNGQLRSLSLDKGPCTWPSFHRIFSLSSLGPYFVIGHSSPQTRFYIYKVVEDPNALSKAARSPNNVTCFPVIRLKGATNRMMTAMHLKHNMLIAIDNVYCIYIWIFKSLSRFDDMPVPASGNLSHVDVIKKPILMPLEKGTVTVLKVVHHKGHIVVLTAMNVSVISVITKKIHTYKLTDFGMARDFFTIKCMASWGPILAFASDRGQVLLYNIKCMDWAGNLMDHFWGAVNIKMELTHMVLTACEGGPVIIGYGAQRCICVALPWLTGFCMTQCRDHVVNLTE